MSHESEVLLFTIHTLCTHTEPCNFDLIKTPKIISSSLNIIITLNYMGFIKALLDYYNGNNQKQDFTVNVINFGHFCAIYGILHDINDRISRQFLIFYKTNSPKCLAFFYAQQ